MGAVDKLIYNCLVQYGNVALPGVGSLEVVSIADKRTGATMAAPRKRIAFSSRVSKQFIPITEIIAEQGNIDDAAASKIYGEWLIEAKNEDGTVKIEGVGELRKKQFVISEQMNMALNGEPLPDVELRKHRDCRKGWIIALAILLGLSVATWFLVPNTAVVGRVWDFIGVDPFGEVEFSAETEPFETVEIEAEVTPTDDIALHDDSSATDSLASNEPLLSPSDTIVAAIGKYRYNVAVGVFAIKGNARRWADTDPVGIGAQNYLISPFPSGMEVVIAYSTDDWNEVVRAWSRFKRIQEDVWVYRRY